MKEFTTASNEKGVELNVSETIRCFELLKDYHPVQMGVQKNEALGNYEIVMKCMNFKTPEDAISYANEHFTGKKK